MGALAGDSLANRFIFGLWRPKLQILGSDIAGRVEAVGRNVQRFQPGDPVFRDLSGRWGGFAEYVFAPATALVLKPPTMTFALQLAALHGAEVTAVDAPGKLELLRRLGAAQVIDYTATDFTRTGQPYDRILDVKTTRSMFDCARALAPGGVYVTVGGDLLRLLQVLLLMPWIALTQRKRMRLLALKPNDGLAASAAYHASGQVLPVLEGPYALSEVPWGFQHFAVGRHRGKVVFTMAPDPGQPSATQPPG